MINGVWQRQYIDLNLTGHRVFDDDGTADYVIQLIACGEIMRKKNRMFIKTLFYISAETNF